MLLANRMNHLFDEMFRDPFFTSSTWFDHSQMMRTDVQEKEENYMIDMELPGYSKDEIQAKLEDGYLTISANHNESNDKKDEEGNYIRRERYVGTCERTFFVGKETKQEDIQAAFKDGILRLVIPKASKKIEEQPKMIEIK